MEFEVAFSILLEKSISNLVLYGCKKAVWAGTVYFLLFAAGDAVYCITAFKYSNYLVYNFTLVTCKQFV